MADNNKRIAHIDQIKGFAIFLVVLAHVMAWTYPDWKMARNHDNVATMLWWKMIYSFHMPLFFCVSGYLCSIKKGYFLFIKKRVQSLLLPFLTFMFLDGLLSGSLTCNSGPWFLKTLFLFTLIYALSRFIQKCMRTDNGLVLLLSMLMFFVLFRKLIFSFQSENLNQIIDISHLSEFNYVGFIMGVALKEYKSIYEKINKEWGGATMLLLWLTLFILRLHHVNIPYISYILIEASAIMAIWLFYDLNQSIRKSNGAFRDFTNNALELLGIYSLHIYLLHLFIRIRIVEIGQYFLSLADKNEYTLSITLCTLQLVYSVVLTALIVVLCLLTAKFVEHFKMFNFVLFGKTK